MFEILYLSLNAEKILVADICEIEFVKQHEVVAFAVDIPQLVPAITCYRAIVLKAPLSVIPALTDESLYIGIEFVYIIFCTC